MFLYLCTQCSVRGAKVRADVIKCGSVHLCFGQDWLQDIVLRVHLVPNIVYFDPVL